MMPGRRGGCLIAWGSAAPLMSGSGNVALCRRFRCKRPRYTLRQLVVGARE